jgi:antitoxin component of RelBE/YafQ-DinJ toxin-antitoxin module
LYLDEIRRQRYVRKIVVSKSIHRPVALSWKIHCDSQYIHFYVNLRNAKMVAAVQPEIRLRLDRQEAEKFEQVGAAIGLSVNDMVKVFVRRTIAAGGLPFDMKMPAHNADEGERFMPVFGQSPTLLAEVASNAAREAALGHMQAGRLPDTRTPDAGSARKPAQR